MTFAEKLKVLRDSRQLTKKDIAERLKISIHTYSSWESGRTRPKTKEKIKNISEFYRIPIEYFGIDEKTYNKDVSSKKVISKKESISNEIAVTILDKNSSKRERNYSKKKVTNDDFQDEELSNFFAINKNEKTLLEIMILVLNKYSQFGGLVNTELCNYFLTGKTWLSFIPFTIKTLSKIHIEKCSISTLILCGFERYNKDEFLIPYWIYPFLPKKLAIKNIYSYEDNPKTINELVKQNIQYGDYKKLYVSNTKDTCIEYTISTK